MYLFSGKDVSALFDAVLHGGDVFIQHLGLSGDGVGDHRHELLGGLKTQENIQ